MGDNWFIPVANMNGGNYMKFEAALEKLNGLSGNKASSLSNLFDDGSYTELERFTKNGDEECDIVTAYGLINGVMTFAFYGSKGVNGAMGRVLAAKIEKVYSLAAKVGAPVVAVYNSDGAHIDEGIEAMEAYGSLMAKIASLSGVVPQISVIAGDCIGSAAVMAAMADIVIMVKDANMYVTAGSVLKNDKVGTSKLAAENGTAAIVTDTEAEAFDKVAEIITYLPQNNLSIPYAAEYVPSSATVDSSDTVKAIEASVDAGSFCELYSEHATLAKVGFARVNGVSVGVVATNGEKLDAAAAKKMARFVRFMDAFSLPVITFVDSLGILGNEGDEISGGVKCTAQLVEAYAEATTAKISVVTGAACGASYIALASKAAGIDSVFAWPNAYISALQPDTAVELLMKDGLAEGKTRDELKSEYIDGEASAFAAAEKGFVEDVINPLETAPKLATALDMLSSKRISTLDKKHSNIQL